MLLAFGTSQHPQPTIIPIRVVRMLDAAVPLSAFVLSGMVVVMTLVLWALYRWTRFGLATRAASENDVAARLAGLSPNELSLANSILAGLVLGTLGIFAGSVAALDTTTLPFLVVPARRRPLRAAHLAHDRVRVRSRDRDGRVADRVRVDEDVVPDQRGRGLARRQGAARLRAHRGGDAALRRVVADARRPVEQRLQTSRGPKHAYALAIPSTLLCAIALVVLPFDFRQALTNSLIGIVMASRSWSSPASSGRSRSSSSRSPVSPASPCRTSRSMPGSASAGAARGRRRACCSAS